MKVILLLAVLASFAFALSEKQYQSVFTSWMQLHKKSYHHDVFGAKFRVWKANFDFIQQHNKSNKTFTVAMNKFGDLTNEEFARVYLGARYTAKGKMLSSEPKTGLPTSVDWRTKGAVTPVKNQQQCGSCWSFSTTGTVEGCNFLTGSKKLISLSEQNLMDCSFSQGNQGCDGGLMTQAFQYIIDNNGIDTEKSYPYTAQDGTCHYKAANKGANLHSYVNVSQGDENDLQSKVAVGPTSVAIDASQNSFQFYSSGVYYEPQCSSTQLDHGVLSVGYGHDNSGGDYWIVKNSWGTDWGQNGYIWMARNKNNNCGIATMASLATKC